MFYNFQTTDLTFVGKKLRCQYTLIVAFRNSNTKWHYISYLMYLFHYVSSVHVDEIVSSVGLVSFSSFLFGVLLLL